MGRSKTSLVLFKRSLSVIAQNRALLLFPVIALIFILIIVLFFLSPFFLRDTGYALTDPFHWKACGDHLVALAKEKQIAGEQIAAGVTGFFFIYLASIFLATFFDVAFYNEILNALNGNQVSISRGIRVALSKIKAILIWSMFAGIVGIIINALEAKLDFVGRWVAKVIGITWSVASIFIIPVIIREEKSVNPLKLLKSSATMLKKTWGESVAGFLGIGSGFIIGILALIILFVIILIVVGSTIAKLWAAVATLFLLFISMLAFGCLWSVIGQIYRCALYVYASEGVVPGPFNEEMMNMAWKVKAVRKE